MVLIGLASGIGCGILFGEYCANLSFIGDAFIALLRMTVLPYIMVSLIANLGGLSFKQSRRLAVVGGIVLLSLWALVLVTVFALSMTFPEWKSGSFYSSAIAEEPGKVDFVDLFIPDNIFSALSENRVPAVVLFCVCSGLALSGIKGAEPLVAQLNTLARVLIRISHYVVRLAPIGVFAMAASTAGTISLNEAGRLQAYLVAYTCGGLFFGFIVLPLLITTCTPFRYREVMRVSKDAAITAFATGKLIIVLPLLIEQTEKLFEEHRRTGESAAPEIDILYPVAYPFPHVGKLLSMLFIPFAGWFLGNSLAPHEFPGFLAAGVVSYFGGPLLAMPFLLDMMHLPRDMMHLFVLSGVWGERVGDSLGVMHLVAFTLITTTAFLGRLRLKLLPLVKYLVVVTILGVLMVGGLRVMLSRTLRYTEGKDEIILNMQLLEEPVEHVVIPEASPNPQPLLPGETLLERIQRRGVIRVGYNEDKLPFAYFNIQDELVGFDVNMAHAFARDLGVSIEFVRFDRASLADQLANDDFDVVMSGLVGTLERARDMENTTPYLDVTLGFVVPDYRVRRFESIDSLRREGKLKIGFVDLTRGFVERLQVALPDAEFIELPTSQQYFTTDWEELDAFLTSAESGSAFTLFYPEFECVVPRGLEVSQPLFYAVGARDDEMKDLLEHWVSLRKKDGTVQEYYDHWILGKLPSEKQRRWCVIRDVLHWVD